MPGPEFDPETATLLYFKVGALGSTPLDFCRMVATSYDAHYFSSGRLRDLITNERNVVGNSKPASTEDIGKRLIDEATPILIDEVDVIADVFFNSPKTRAHVPISLARQTNAFSVALNVFTPVRIMKDRVEKWTKEGTLIWPDERKVQAVNAMQRMLTDVRWTQENEGVDIIFNLDGSDEDVSVLVGQVGSHLDELGLMENVQPQP